MKDWQKLMMAFGALQSFRGQRGLRGIARRTTERYARGGGRGEADPGRIETYVTPRTLLGDLSDEDAYARARYLESVQAGEFGGVPRVQQAEATMAGWEEQKKYAAGTTAGITGEWKGDEGEIGLKERLTTRLETPAVSQREVDLAIEKMRGELSQGTRRRVEEATAGAGARGVGPGAIAAIEAGLKGEAGRSLAGSRIGAELERTRLNRLFESQYMDQLMRGTRDYMGQWVPARNLETALQADPGVWGSLGDVTMAIELLEQGDVEGANAILANARSAMGQQAVMVPLAAQIQDYQMEQQQGPGLWEQTGAGILGGAGAIGGGMWLGDLLN